MADFLLLHGAYHTGACWEPVAARLRAAGHGVDAPDLPPNDELDIPAEDVDLAVYADWVAERIRRGGRPVILVGHSLAGATIGPAAERVPELVRDLVYLTALMPPPGESIAQCRRRLYGPGAPNSDTARYRTLHAGGRVATIDPEGALAMMYQRCDPAEARAALASLRPQPLRIYDDPIELTPERWGAIRRTYVLALEDRTLPGALSAFMLEDPGADRVEVIDSDHSPFLSAPDRVTRLLLDVAALPEPQMTPSAASSASSPAPRPSSSP